MCIMTDSSYQKWHFYCDIANMYTYSKKLANILHLSFYLETSMCMLLVSIAINVVTLFYNFCDIFKSIWLNW